MAVRLQLKLGIVAEQDRLPDSPDTLVVVEPSVGSVARSKGHLYLLVTSRVVSRHALEATRLAAETIRNEYYYDESAGIRVCLQKAIVTANKKLSHQADRLGLKSGDANGPIGIGVAVVRGNEMYVATVGPAEAYLIRQARLSTLPDPHRERGLPSADLEPDIWRGEVSVGDSLVLISPNMVAKLGADELKDAMLTLHPQSAMEHLHHRFVAADGSGSDGAIAFEATEVSSTARGRSLVPVRPATPLAGVPDRSPIPLADNVQAAGVAVSAAAGNARTAAGTAVQRAVARVQALMPRRKPAYRRITPLASRRETQRRAALAVLALVGVVLALGLGVYAFGGSAPPEEAIAPVNAGQAAMDAAREDLARVSGPGIDLVADDPKLASELLTDAYRQLDAAEAANVSASAIAPLRDQTIKALDRLYGVVPVRSETLFTFVPAEGAAPIELRAMVRGPDGVPYVIDRSTRAVYRVDLEARRATIVARVGMKHGGATFSNARYLGVGGPDLLILDAKSVLWRWRPADTEGNGTLARVRVEGSPSWGSDVTGFNTFLRDASRGLYNLYVIDPSEQQIRAYSPAADGSGFPAASTAWLATVRDVSKMGSTFLDGDFFAIDGGALVRFRSGKDDGWEASAPLDTLLRPASSYTLVAGAEEREKGNVYAFDRANSRIIAVDKVEGAYVAQYRLAGGVTDWTDFRAMYIIPGIEDGPATVVWLSIDGIHQAVLEAVPDVAPEPTPTPTATSSPVELSPDPSATVSPEVSPEATPSP